MGGVRELDDLVVRRIDAGDGSGGAPDGDFIDAGDSIRFHLTDGQFSTVAVVDDLGALNERVSYDPYGRARHHWAEDVDGDGDQDTADSSGLSLVDITNAAYNVDADLDRDGDVDAADTTALAGTTAALAPGRLSGEDNHFGYSGYVYNAETELYTVRFRHYHAALGRWLERDPLEYEDSANLYEYVASDPAGATDPTGQARLSRDPDEDRRLKGDIPGFDDVYDGRARYARDVRERLLEPSYRAVIIGWKAVGFLGLLFLTPGIPDELALLGLAFRGRGIGQMVWVSRWGRLGLRPGDWVMRGRMSWWNYIFSGKWQWRFTNKFTRYRSGQQFLVPKKSVKWPTGERGIALIKGLLGQRKYCP